MRRTIGFGSVSAIISGHNMQGMDGLKTAMRIKKNIKTSSCAGDGIHELRTGWI